MDLNKKGFTLVEVLAVIIIVCLLALLVIPQITDSISNFKDKTDDLTLSIITSAAELYIQDYEINVEDSICINIDELVDKEYLKRPVEYKKEDITDTNSLKVINNNGFDFELIENKDCTF